MSQLVPIERPGIQTGTALIHYNPRVHALVSALPMVAQAIGARHDIEVSFGKRPPKSAPRVIYLPELPLEDPRVGVLAFGMLEHQIAHILQTTPVDTQHQLHSDLCELIEGPRAENAFLDRYPGYRSDLDGWVKEMLDTGRLSAPTPQDSPRVLLEKHLLFNLNRRLRGQEFLREAGEQAQKLIREVFPPAACVRINSVLARASGLQCTQDSAELAADLLNILKEEAQEPPPPPPAGSSGQQQQNGQQAGDGSTPQASQQDPSGTYPGSGGTQGPQADQGNGRSPAPEPSGGQGDGAQQAQQRANLREVLNSADQHAMPHLNELGRNALDQEAAKAVKAVDGRLGGERFARKPLTPSGLSAGAALAQVNGATMALQSRVRGLLASDRAPADRYTLFGNRIDPRRLSRLARGDRRVFCRRARKVDVLTVVQLLLDRSESMEKEARMQLAARACLSIESALAPIRGLTVGSAVFPGCMAPVDPLTRPGQPLYQTAHLHLGVVPEGGTPLYSALCWAAHQLMMRREPRKILVLVSDGYPAKPNLCRQTVALLERAGIEVYGIGIQSPQITSLIPISRSIEGLHDLTPAMFEVLQTALLNKKSR